MNRNMKPRTFQENYPHFLENSNKKGAFFNNSVKKPSKSMKCNISK